MLVNNLTNAISGWGFQAALGLPLLVTLWIAWGDIRTRRIPNYLTLGVALAGLGFQLGSHGLSGLLHGFLGLALGFGLLIIPYILGGMGAGDVKALAALGAWLGPLLTFRLTLYMAIAGGLIALGFLGWRGMLRGELRKFGVSLVNWILCRPYGLTSPAPSAPKTDDGIPYGLAMALGMLVLFIRGE
jgi:prepilin peptidase CpaA